jgi:peptidyl-dipeptidase Dcp
VEYPSQVNEIWASDPEVLANYAKHVQTGEQIPSAMIASMDAAGLYGEGFATTEILAATLLDQAWHRLTPAQAPSAAEVADFEAQALQDAGVDYPLVPPRYRSTYFSHIWGPGYAGAYYAYQHSKMFDADTVEWFTENGGLTRANGDKFRVEVLSQGNSRNPLDSYLALRGRPVVVEPLLRRRNLLGS